MDRIYSFTQPVGLDWLAHAAQDTWNYGGSPLKKRRTSKDIGGYASIVQPLTKLVRESLDTVHNLTEALATLNVGVGEYAALSDEQFKLVEEDRERLIQTERLRAAKAHGEWIKAAKELDELDGVHKWKALDESEYYDHEDLRRKLQNLESARDNEDLYRMLQVIRTELGRDVAGIGHPKLYEHTRIGTKDLIERYVTTAVDTIESAMRLAARSRDGRVANDVRQHVVETRQAYGRTGLLLSGGGTMGMMHIGVVKAMFEAGVLPRVISGASAGSIVAAVVCTKTDNEIPQLLEEFCNDLDVFTKGEDQARWSNMMYRLFTKGALYDIKNLEDVMQTHVKDMTFQEAYNRTQRILSVAVSHENAKGEPLLLNYATTPNVLIRSAVAASCSVPFIYRPAPLLERDPYTDKIQRFGGPEMYFIDGSVSHDIPLSRLRAMLDVNHFIVSQVNPHIVPFIRKGQTGADIHPSQRSWTDTITELARTEAVHRLRQLSAIPIPAIRKLTHIGSSILEQTYTGDITILPETSFGFEILSNPTPKFMADAMEKGERATWPELDRIERRTAVERAIEKSVLSARERVVFSDSQVDLRLSRIRKQSTAEKLRGRRRSGRAGHRATGSMVLTGSQGFRSSPPSIRFNPSRSSSEDGMHASRSPSLIPDLTSSTPQLSDTDESENEDDHQVHIHRRARKINNHVPNWPYGSASQPATPAASISKAFNFSPTPRPHSPVPMLANSATFAMTPSSPASSTPTTATTGPATATTTTSGQTSPRPPSSPELRYKRLFHGVKNLPIIRSAGSKSPDPALAPANTPVTTTESGAVPRHEEGRRSSFLSSRRGRRSTSTGLRGLMPPGRQ